jgi:phosphoribosylanthranilate isomerase
MALRFPVKLGRVTNLSDARYGAGMGVSYLAFPIGNGIDLQTFKEIAGWISGPRLVAEVSDPAAPWLTGLPDIIRQFPIEMLTEAARRLQPGPWIVQGAAGKFIARMDELEALRDNILFLEVTDGGGCDGAMLKTLVGRFPVWAPAGSRPVDALMQRGFSGLSLEGSAEERAGMKDYGSLAAVLESLEVDG